jgi:hypothetical protein
MKQLLFKILVTLIIIGWFSISALADYTWSEKIIKQKNKDGWTVAATNDNLVDITHPWTIIKTPITTIAFLKTENIKINNDIRTTEILWVEYYKLSSTREEISPKIYNCDTRKSAYISKSIDIHDLSWKDPIPETPGDQITNFICSYEKN